MIVATVRHKLRCDLCRTLGPEADTVTALRAIGVRAGWGKEKALVRKRYLEVWTEQDVCPDCVRERASAKPSH